MAQQPRINSALVEAIRMAKISKKASSDGSAFQYQYMQNDDRPDKAYRTERAKRAGKANASSGQIFVTIAPDHFGPLQKMIPKGTLVFELGKHGQTDLNAGNGVLIFLTLLVLLASPRMVLSQ